jgi:putative methyltransferase (TIGR04325 family)
MIHSIKNILRQRLAPYGWDGQYATWDEALRASSGYDSEIIIDKVKSALLEVRNGRGAYERDSVLFEKADYNWQLLSALLWVFNREPEKVTITDFGGSLGSSYFQHRKWLAECNYTWNIVEQPKFVTEGKKHFENPILKFWDQVVDIKQEGSSFLILSSVLAYLERPYEWLHKFLDMRYDYIFIDRTPLISGLDRLTVQRVPKQIYEASYPAWFFNKNTFLQTIEKNYNIFSEHTGEEKTNFPSEFIGFFLTLKK